MDRDDVEKTRKGPVGELTPWDQNVNLRQIVRHKAFGPGQLAEMGNRFFRTFEPDANGNNPAEAEHETM